MKSLRIYLGVILVLVGLSTPGWADQFRFNIAARDYTYYGYLQYANMFFIQGYLAQVGRPAGVTDRKLKLWVIRGHQTRSGWYWNSVTGNEPVVAEAENPEGQVVTGYPCGFFVNLMAIPQSQRPVANDILLIKLAQLPGRGDLINWQQPGVLFFQRVMGVGGPDPDQVNPDKSESQGRYWFQGRFQQTRLSPQANDTYMRGYAYDLLAAMGQRGPYVYPVVNVVVDIGQRPIGSSPQTPYRTIETESALANQRAPLPLYGNQRQPPDQPGTSWNFGFTAKFSRAMQPNMEYLVTLREQTYSGGRLVLDRRVMRVTGVGSMSSIVDFSLQTGSDLNAPEITRMYMTKNWQNRRDKAVLERMKTRALLSREEFYRLTPQGNGEGKSAFWRPAPEMLYGHQGQDTSFNRSYLPPPRGKTPLNDTISLSKLGRADLASNASGGGWNPTVTRSLWLRLADASDSENYRYDRKAYIYDWMYTEPYYERYISDIYRNTKEKKIRETLWKGLAPNSVESTAATSSTSGPRLLSNDVAKISNDEILSAANSQAFQGGNFEDVVRVGEEVRLVRKPGMGSSPCRASFAEVLKFVKKDRGGGDDKESEPATAGTTPPASQPGPGGAAAGGFNPLDNMRSNEYIKIFMDGAGRARPWGDLKGPELDELERYQRKLNAEFNNYKMKIGVGAFGPQLLEVMRNRPNDPPESRADGSQPMRVRIINVTLQGRWDESPYDDGKEVHPLKVTVKYAYDKGVEFINGSAGPDPIPVKPPEPLPPILDKTPEGVVDLDKFPIVSVPEDR